MRRTFLAGLGVAGVLVVGAAQNSLAQDEPPFGGPDSVSYAEDLWEVLVEARLAGPDAIRSHFYEGIEPHGFVLETMDTAVTVGDHTGRVVVKNNYGPEGVSAEEASNAPGEHLDAVTVMFRREAGYDPDNQNWFWAKYFPDGSLDATPTGMALAGRVAKGAETGCIACHTAADGDDYLFITNRGD